MNRRIETVMAALCALTALVVAGCGRDRDQPEPVPDSAIGRSEPLIREPKTDAASGTVITTNTDLTEPGPAPDASPNSAAGGGDASVRSGMGPGGSSEP